MAEIFFGKTLSELRVEKGVTQEEVAGALGVSNKTVSKWENGDSAPDLATLAELAKYYDVSTDVLLGLKSRSQSTEDLMAEAFKGLDRRQAALKLFDMLKATFPPCFDAVGTGFDDVCDNADTIPTKTDPGDRYSISLHELFHFLVCSEDVNLAVVQLRNRSDFSWLVNEKKQQKIGSLLTFLADPDTMRILYFIHSTGCSESFTAEYMAKHTLVDHEKTVQILDRCCEIGICDAVVAHLTTGDVKVYESFGDGLVLSVFALAYERMCGKKYYNYCYNSRCKMIKETMA